MQIANYMKSKSSTGTSSMFSIGRPYQICLLCFIVLAIYYQTIFAEISLLDDHDVISGLFNTDTFDLKSIFFPHVKDGGYYRPFIGVLYLIDRFWWFLDSKIMHFENILMHLFNTIMVFWIGVKLCQTKGSDKTTLPLWGAVLFALHPINTESVNWISGRTDAMACMFVLSSLLLVLVYLEKGNKLLLPCAYIFIFLGILAKETALGFIPGSVFILLSTQQNGIPLNCKENNSAGSALHDLILFLYYAAVALLTAILFVNYYLVILIGVAYLGHCLVRHCQTNASRNICHRIRAVLMIVVAIILMIAIYHGFRKAAFVSDIPKISNTLMVMTADLNYTIELFMGAAGFYVKKFFIPIPLNIAIREVDPLYELFGVVCFLGCMYLVSLRRIESALIIAGFFMLAPAFPLSFGTIAWTAYAERYDYIPSAFWILGGIGAIRAFPDEMCEKWSKYLKILASVLILAFAAITQQRNIIWKSNVALFKDAVEKSPEFKNVRGIYISALCENQQYDEAEKQYFIARKLNSVKYNECYDLLYASLLMNNKKYAEVEKLFNEVEKKTNGKSTSLYEALIKYYSNFESSATDVGSITYYSMKKITAYEHLYSLNKSPYTSYRLAQAYLSINKRDQAKQAFRIAYEQFGQGEPLKHNAGIILKNFDTNKPYLR